MTSSTLIVQTVKEDRLWRAMFERQFFDLWDSLGGDHDLDVIASDAGRFADAAVRAYRERCAPTEASPGWRVGERVRVSRGDWSSDGAVAQVDAFGMPCRIAYDGGAELWLLRTSGGLAPEGWTIERCAPGASEPAPDLDPRLIFPGQGIELLADRRWHVDAEFDDCGNPERVTATLAEASRPGEIRAEEAGAVKGPPLDAIRTAYYEGGESVDLLEREHGREAVAEALGFEHDEPTKGNGAPVDAPSGAPTGPGWWWIELRRELPTDMARKPVYVFEHEGALWFRYTDGGPRLQPKDARGWGGPCLQGSAPSLDTRTARSEASDPASAARQRRNRSEPEHECQDEDIEPVCDHWAKCKVCGDDSFARVEEPCDDMCEPDPRVNPILDMSDATDHEVAKHILALAADQPAEGSARAYLVEAAKRLKDVPGIRRDRDSAAKGFVPPRPRPPG